MALALAVAQHAAIAAKITVDSERRGDTIEIRASAVLTADAGTVWRVLTAYDRYTDFIPDLHLSRVVTRRGTAVTVEQSGDALLWLFKLPLDITYEINEIPPYRLRSRAVAGSLRALTSCYLLTPVRIGTRLEYVGHIETGFAIFANIEHAVVQRNVARQFRALAEEIERQGLTARSDPKAVVK